MTGRTEALWRLMAPGRRMPVYLLCFVTNRCNASCEHCFYWRELNTRVREELGVGAVFRLIPESSP